MHGLLGTRLIRGVNHVPSTGSQKGSDMSPAKILGVLCILFGIADLALANLEIIDLTGVQWSPIAAFLVGSVLMRVGGSGGGEDGVDVHYGDNNASDGGDGEGDGD